MMQIEGGKETVANMTEDGVWSELFDIRPYKDANYQILQDKRICYIKINRNNLFLFSFSYWKTSILQNFTIKAF